MRRFLSDERSEAGETLIEVLMSSALLGVVVVAVIGGIITMLLGSTLHREQTDANAALVSALEQVKSPEVTRACAVANSSHPYLAGLPSTVSIQTIEYEKIVPDASGNPSVSWSSLLSDCSLTSPLTLQRITVKYTTPDSRVSALLSFIKGDYE
jgi:hypothetical protein